MNNTVIEVAKLNIQGNIIDNGWINNLKYENGKPNMNAIMILSEIFYWYRPIVVKDELTGAVLGYKKKFKGDKLQKSYQALGERFGLTKRQAKLACDYLKDRNLILIEFRNIESNGSTLSNVMYIDLVMENIKKITGLETVIEEYDIPPLDNFEKPCNKPIKSDIPPHRTTECKTYYNEIPPGGTIECKTYTEITTETTTYFNKEEETFKQLVKYYSESKGKKVSPTERDCLFEFYKTYNINIIRKAIEVMAEYADKPSIAYLKATLSDWDMKGLNTIEKVLESIARHELNNSKANENKKKKIKAMAEGNTSYGKKIDNFNNFEQRTYDFDKLEKQLLGWKNDNNIDG